jgi:phosphatidate cytidylyltransferase
MSALLANPAASALFLPTAATLGGLLGAALAALLLAERHHLQELPRRALFRRWLSWLALGPLYLLVVLAGELTFLALILAVSLQGLREYARLVGLPLSQTWLLLAAALALGPLALWSRELFLALPPLLLLLATLPPLVSQDVRSGSRHLAFTVLGLLYLPWLLGHTLLLYQAEEGGPGLLLALGLAVALSDVGAFTLGSLLGRGKLAPRLSPNKTWAGLAGNLLGAALGLALLRFALPELPQPLLLALPLAVGAGAAWGDLLESLLKREFGAKDSGALLPGMGGVLDRVDSFLLAAPLCYWLLRLAS